MNIDQMKALLMRKDYDKPRTVPVSDLLSSGSTLLNCGCSGKHQGAFAKGHYTLLVGDTDSGKTWFSLTLLAEATINPAFDKYRLIHDNAERGALMDIAYYFGTKLKQRMEPPCWDGDDPVYSRTQEEFYYNVDDAIRKGVPFIYVLDSVDVLTSAAEEKKFSENKTAYRKGKEGKGSYGDGKAKTNSSNLRKVVSDLAKTGSILVIINQTRDNINAGPFEQQKTRSGGWALEFYASLQLWCSVKTQIKKTVKGKPRQVGVISRVKVKRSRITGKKHVIEVPIYHGVGIDDVGSCVDYLVSEGKWKNTKGVITVTGLGPTWKADREDVISTIEEKGLEEDLRELVGSTWSEIEELCKVSRKRRYPV